MVARNRNRLDDQDRRLRRWVYVFALIGLLELPYLMWPWLAPLFQPKRYSNHQDQIAAALHQHGVAFTQLYLNQGWPDRINNQTYGANLTIYVSDDPSVAPVSGRIECREQKHHCWYQVAKLNIDREELTDLVSVTTPIKPVPSWPDRMRDALVGLGIRL